MRRVAAAAASAACACAPESDAALTAADAVLDRVSITLSIARRGRKPAPVSEWLCKPAPHPLHFKLPAVPFGKGAAAAFVESGCLSLAATACNPAH
jgi:hypothetical protein